MRYSYCFEWVKRFKTGQEFVKNEEHGNRPSTATHICHVEELRAKVLENGRFELVQQMFETQLKPCFVRVEVPQIWESYQQGHENRPPCAKGLQKPRSPVPPDVPKNPITSSRTKSQEKLCTPVPKENSEAFPCNFCKKTYSRYTGLLQHVKMHTGDTKCKICGKAMSTVENLNRHLFLVHGCPIEGRYGSKELTPNVTLFACDHCKKEYHSRLALIRHMHMHADLFIEHKLVLDSPNADLKPCSFPVDDNQLLDPYRLNPGKALDPKEPLKAVIPEIVGNFGFSSTRRRLPAFAAPSGVAELFACRVCDKTYKTPASLIRHRKMHTGATKCQLCGRHLQPKIFSKEVDLKQPVFWGMNSDPPYERCPRKPSFNSTGASQFNALNILDSYTLSAANLLHCVKDEEELVDASRFGVPEKSPSISSVGTHEKPSSLSSPPSETSSTFTCDRCERSYTRHTSYLAHIKTHTGETNCTFCGKVFSTKGNLKQHLRIIHKLSEEEINGPPDIHQYKCAHCKKSYRSRLGLAYHSKKHANAGI
ncbi:unnamed protein product [Bemisia tabaci]|uniref:C2H2-type domain-containing protein n=1 Tax=Bemisia tabaci TaxID=7038 RepID=A0A9P0F2Y8_BEMTA|nr:unnamed protein product [Bemisia tabaci]